MDFKNIQDLVNLINGSEISELTIENEEGKITIKQKEPQIVSQQLPAFNFGAPYPNVPQPMAIAASPSSNSDNTKPATSTNNADVIVVKSPMIGTFYRKPGPNKPNFIEVGQSINKGDVVCIIEAMKLFNEIESEYQGIIENILVEDATPVEFDQPLFTLKK
ncbi:MAG: acetyl-CoA carboxylase biotin carboxyl carrier protein [Sediminibacterium sp.]|nr:acetyl-CoA carboxylase biotin carboxyl carrier protein [Sediminibacterium sp.]